MSASFLSAMDTRAEDAVDTQMLNANGRPRLIPIPEITFKWSNKVNEWVTLNEWVALEATSASSAPAKD